LPHAAAEAFSFDLRAFDLGTVKSQPGRPREWSLTFRHDFGG
jgi:hypothetical protein